MWLVLQEILIYHRHVIRCLFSTQLCLFPMTVIDASIFSIQYRTCTYTCIAPFPHTCLEPYSDCPLPAKFSLTATRQNLPLTMDSSLTSNSPPNINPRDGTAPQSTCRKPTARDNTYKLTHF